MIHGKMGDKETSKEAISIALMRSFEGPILGRTGGNINKATQLEPNCGGRTK